jgi:hypothetical protein
MTRYVVRLARAVTSHAVAILLATTSAPSVATAQGAPVGRPANAFTLNPLGLPFEVFAAEFERRLSDMTTLGLSGSYFGPGDDFSISSLDAKLRLYPNEEALRGFSVGVSLGVWHGDEDIFSNSSSTTRPAVGAFIDYNWLMGKTKRILVGTGIGGKRVFGNGDDFDDLPFAYPTARFQIGVLY